MFELPFKAILTCW